MLSVLSRYIARRLLARVAVLLLGLAALMIILDFLANGDQVIAKSDSILWPVLRYTVLRLPEILALLLPITAMLAALLTFAELVRHSELTAMAAAGISNTRLAAAVLPVALLIGAVQFLIEDQAVPLAVGRLRALAIGDYAPAADAEAAGIWLRHGDDILRIRAPAPREGRLDGVTIFERDPEGNLVAELQAPSATYEDGGWTLHDVTRAPIGAGAVEHEARLRWQGDLSPTLLTTERPDAVFLAAAKVGGIRANDTYNAEFIRDNLAIQTNAIHSAWKHGTQKLLFLGSSCIYPRLASQPLHEDALLSGPLEPTNEAYAIAKIAGLKMCQAYRRQHVSMPSSRCRPTSTALATTTTAKTHTSCQR